MGRLRVTDRPIIFSAPMVRALLAGRKTQTRRLMIHTPLDIGEWTELPSEMQESLDVAGWQQFGFVVANPRFDAGDRLWVRETWAVGNIYDGVPPRNINPGGKPGWCGVRYAATDQRLGLKDRASIHMPRWASRLTLEVGAVRVQRLHDISESDAEAEGMPEPYLGDADPPWEEMAIMISRTMQFRNLWNKLRGPGAWTANPWVAASTFSVTHANIDAPVGREALIA